MKAAFLIAPKKYVVREIQNPWMPPDGLVLRVEACGVCGSDLRRWREGPPAGMDGIISGHEISGVVAEVGDQVKRYKVGQRLAVAPDVHCGCCDFCENGQYNLCDNLHLIGITPGYPGGFAEKIILSGEILRNGIVHGMPEGMSFLEGALAEPASSVLASHDRACTDLGKVVVVMGGGPIGCLHITIARARGASVILSEPNPDRREMAKAFLPDLILDPSGEDVVTKVKAFTSGRGADIVICANPVAETQTQAVEIVRKGGKVVLFGGLPKNNPMTYLDGNLIHYGEIEVVGSFSYHPTFHAHALDVIRRGLIPSEKLITHRYSLDEINEAFRTAASGKALKVVIQIQQ
jgi:L-iditol 2-dehydrogenase